MGLNLSGELGTLGNVSESRVWLIPQGSWRGLPTVMGELAGRCLVPPPPPVVHRIRMLSLSTAGLVHLLSRTALGSPSGLLAPLGTAAGQMQVYLVPHAG